MTVRRVTIPYCNCKCLNLLLELLLKDYISHFGYHQITFIIGLVLVSTFPVKKNEPSIPSFFMVANPHE